MRVSLGGGVVLRYACISLGTKMDSHGSKVNIQAKLVKKLYSPLNVATKMETSRC